MNRNPSVDYNVKMVLHRLVPALHGQTAIIRLQLPPAQDRRKSRPDAAECCSNQMGIKWPEMAGSSNLRGSVAAAIRGHVLACFPMAGQTFAQADPPHLWPLVGNWTTCLTMAGDVTSSHW